MISPQKQQQIISQKPSQRYKSKLKLYLINGNISLSCFYMGYIQIYLAAIQIQTIISIYSINIDKNAAQGLLNCCIPLGAVFGGLSIQLLLSKLSRRKSLLVINLIAFIAGILIYIPNFYSLVAFRLIQGICAGFYSGLPILMIKQISPIELSGTMGNLTQLNLNIGLIFGYLIAYILIKITGDSTGQSFWYIIFGIPLVLIVIQSIILIWIFPYQTPKYLLMYQNPQQAEQLINTIYKSQFVQQIMTEKIKDIQKICQGNTSQYLSLKKQQYYRVTEDNVQSIRHNRIANLAAIHVAICLQLTGVSVLNVYCGPIAQKKVTGEIKLLVPTLLNIIKFIGAILGSIIISRFNRKSILQIGLFQLFIANTLIFLGFYIKSDELQDTSMYMIVFGMVLFLGCFGGTLGPISWLYISEIAQPQMFSISVAIIWTCSALVVLLFPIIEQKWLDGNPGMLFLFFALYCVFSFIVNYFLLVQTRNKTEREIQEEYQNLKLC